MNTRHDIARSRVILALALGSLLLVLAACGGGDDTPQQRAGTASGQDQAAADAPRASSGAQASSEAQTSSEAQASSEAQTGDDAHGAHGNVAMLAGVVFTPPAHWLDIGSSGMRQAQYRLDPVAGDAEQAEVNVFYFGPQSGGGTEANLRRWMGQMEVPGGGDAMEAAERSSFEADGMPVHVISLDGTYKAGSMRPMGGEKIDPRPGYRLVGVVVEGPQGSLFFKLTGPEATARAMEGGLLDMVRGAKQNSG
jgi:hypothetical protein